MATIPDSVKARLDADWTGAGGAEPTYYVEEDFRTNPPLGKDAVWIMSSTLDTDPRPFNDKYTNEYHILEMVVNTLTSEDRLKELSDEVVRILNATTITDITYQRLKKRRIVSGVDKGVFNYQELITYDLRQQMKSSTAAYGSGATGDFTITGDLIVGGDDIKDSSSATVISFDGAGAIDVLAAPHALLTDTTLTGAYLEDLLMFGSANAAWVPLVMFAAREFSYIRGTGGGLMQNVGADDITLELSLPLPTNKGGLKLYISSLKFGVADADATDYITTVRVYGMNGNSAGAQLDIDTTNHSSAGDKTFAGAVIPAGTIDCSGYQSIIFTFSCTNTDANDMDIGNFRAECYYAT